MNSPKKNNSKVTVKRTFNPYGKWVFKPLRSTIVTCDCGNKYIVVRKNQTKCLNCISGKTIGMLH